MNAHMEQEGSREATTSRERPQSKDCWETTFEDSTGEAPHPLAVSEAASGALSDEPLIVGGSVGVSLIVGFFSPVLMGPSCDSFAFVFLLS